MTFFLEAFFVCGLVLVDALAFPLELVAAPNHKHQVINSI